MEEERQCRSCKKVLPATPDYFHRHRNREGGIKKTCKDCANATVRKSWKKYGDRYREKGKEWARKNRRAAFERMRNDPIRWARHQQRNKDKAIIRNREVKQATPPWTSKDELREFYEFARELSDYCGTKFHVDHVVPINAKNACGLHCPENLQIVLARENCSKKNNWNPDCEVDGFSVFGIRSRGGEKGFSLWMSMTMDEFCQWIKRRESAE